MDESMNNSGVLGVFGEFLDNIQNTSFDDDWMQHARIISGLHLCDNVVGVKTMIKILDLINAKYPLVRGGRVWKITSVDISSDPKNLVVNIQFTGSWEEQAYAICRLRANEDPVIVEVDSSGLGYGSISPSSSPYTWTVTTNNNSYLEGYADDSEGDNDTQDNIGRGYIAPDDDQYTHTQSRICNRIFNVASDGWESSYVC